MMLLPSGRGGRGMMKGTVLVIVVVVTVVMKVVVVEQ